MTSTPQRNVRIPDDEWLKLLAIAEAEGTTVSAIIRKLARDYINKGNR